VRRIVTSALVLAAAVLLQLTTVNGLRLPGGGVPDLVLVVVAALGLASGPASGAIAGFAAGLALDLAPPGSGVLGEYALVFVLVGGVCGRLRGTLSRSAVLPIVIVAAAAAVAEILIAGLSVALQSAQVSWAAIRQLLPSAVSYDIALSPFVLYLVLLAGAWLAESSHGRLAQRPVGRALAAGQAGSAARMNQGLAGRRGLAGGAPGSSGAGDVVLLGLGGWLSGPPEGRRDRRAAARRMPRLRPGAGRPGDGWIGGSAASRALSGTALQRSAIRGRAFRGQPPGGSLGSLGGQAPAGTALRGQAFRGATISQLRGGHGRPASPGRLRGGTAGSAVSQIRRTVPLPPARLRLGARRGRARLGGWLGGGGGPGSSHGRGAVRPRRSLDRGAMARLGRRRSRRAGGFRPSGMPGGSTAYRPSGAGLARAVPTIRMGPAGGGRGRDGVIGGGALTRPGPGSGRRAARRLRIQPGPSAGAGAGARRPATPRFRARPLAGASPMNGKRPRFSRRRWRVLAVLTSRPGSRRDVWRVSGRRPG
jgi:rod shape-determining protein MreD